MRIIPEYKVSEFRGLLTEQKDFREIPDGFSPDSLNWVVQTNKRGIELRRGSAVLGQTKDTTVGKVTGLGVGIRADGTQVPFFTHGRKLKYYDSATDDTVEVSTTDLLPTTATNDDISIFPYQNLAGNWIYLSSPNSSIYKVPVANPASVKDLAVTNYRGFLKFGQSRAFLYDRKGNTLGNEDKIGLYASCVDKVDLSQYPAQVTSEAVGTGDGVLKTFTDTLTQITSKRTAMFVTVTDGVETFSDNRNGVLVGSAGGTGTVNYATGAISVTFNTAPLNLASITANYYYEDATAGGIADFDITDPSNRVAGEGNYFPQFDGGGPLHSVFPLATVFYCFHEIRTWQVAIPVDDESGTDSISTNLPFRETMGVRSHFAAYGGDHGIYFINTASRTKAEFMRLELYMGATQANIAAPRSLSETVDFSDYEFDDAVVFEWGEYILLSCQKKIDGVAEAHNTRTFIYNKKNGVWDVTDFPCSRMAEYNGSLIAGDPLSNNVYVLFSGFDDDGAENIQNYWTSGQTDLGIRGTKRFTRMGVEGLIQDGQSYDVQLSYDGADWVTVFTVESDGDYVDSSQTTTVGSQLIGSGQVGGGLTVDVHPYQVEFTVQSPRHTHVRMRIEAQGLGYVSLTSYHYKDIREKSGRVMPNKTAV